MMTLFAKLKQIERLDYLIRIKGTGSPKILSQKMNISERQVYHLINVMKDMGAPISFDYANNSYRYNANVKFTYGFVCKDSEQSSVLGGQSMDRGFPSIYKFSSEYIEKYLFIKC